MSILGNGVEDYLFLIGHPERKVFGTLGTA